MPKIDISGVPYAQKIDPPGIRTPNSKSLTEALNVSSEFAFLFASISVLIHTSTNNIYSVIITKWTPSWLFVDGAWLGDYGEIKQGVSNCPGACFAKGCQISRIS